MNFSERWQGKGRSFLEGSLYFMWEHSDDFQNDGKYKPGHRINRGDFEFVPISPAGNQGNQWIFDFYDCKAEPDVDSSLFQWSFF